MVHPRITSEFFELDPTPTSVTERLATDLLWDIGRLHAAHIRSYCGDEQLCLVILPMPDSIEVWEERIDHRLGLRTFETRSHEDRQTADRDLDAVLDNVFERWHRNLEQRDHVAGPDPDDEAYDATLALRDTLIDEATRSGIACRTQYAQEEFQIAIWPARSGQWGRYSEMLTPVTPIGRMDRWNDTCFDTYADLDLAVARIRSEAGCYKDFLESIAEYGI